MGLGDRLLGALGSIFVVLLSIAIATGSAAWTMRRKHSRLPSNRPFVTKLTFGLLGAASAWPAIFVSGLWGLALLVVVPRWLVFRARRKRWTWFPGLSPDLWIWVTSSSGGVLVCYRREDTPHLAGRLAERLGESLGDERVIIDVESIAPGLDVVEEVERAVEACQVMLVVIGDKWLNVFAPSEQQYLNAPEDYVRLEIEAGLRHDLRIIPVLVDGATMPMVTELPASLSGLARRGAVEARHATFDRDVNRLVEVVKQSLET